MNVLNVVRPKPVSVLYLPTSSFLHDIVSQSAVQPPSDWMQDVSDRRRRCGSDDRVEGVAHSLSHYSRYPIRNDTSAPSASAPHALIDPA